MKQFLWLFATEPISYRRTIRQNAITAARRAAVAVGFMLLWGLALTITTLVLRIAQ